jgi:hypothetical protein
MAENFSLAPTSVQVALPTEPWKYVPVFIINRDRLDCGFKQLLEWLRKIGMLNIGIIDNQSTYPPLLKFYDELIAEKKVQIMRASKNGGPWVFWEGGLHMQQANNYIVTDPDVVPALDCPDDIIDKMLRILTLCPQVTKVGPSLRIDNLPDTYAKKQDMLGYEGGYWTRPVTLANTPTYQAGIDTTFAMYRAYSPLNRCHVTNFRMQPPYHFEHKPWYVDSANLSEEEVYYRAHRENNWSGC